MLILLTIFLLVFSPLSMLILHLVRPKSGIQGLLAVLTVSSALPMVFFARSNIPRVISLIQWKTDVLFPISPSMMIDDISWYFALALMTLSFSIVITSIAQLGQSTSPDLLPANNKNHPAQPPNNKAVETFSTTLAKKLETGVPANWSFWAAILILTSLGLLAVTSGNILTLLLAWAALDIFELIILLGHSLQSKTREQIILIFSAKMAGIVTLLLTGLILWSNSNSLSFDSISQSTSVYLILAAGLRLGVLPIQLPFLNGLPIQRGLGSALRLVPAAASCILLVRVSNTGVTGSFTPYLLCLTSLAGLYAGIHWLQAKDEVEGGAYWLLGIASLIVATAVLNHPLACLAMSLASLLSGGLIFSMSMRHRNLIPLAIIGVFNLSSLPFSPTWQGTTLYQYSPALGVNLTIFSICSFLFLIIQSFLLAGFIRYALKEIYPPGKESAKHVERWVWLLYPFALIVIIVIHLFIGLMLYPNLIGFPLSAWIIGPMTLIFAGLILYGVWRYPQPSPLVNIAKKTSFWNNLFSLEWLYRLLGKLFRNLSNLFSLFSTILEGDGGILWALVLFALIFVFLQK